MGALWAKLIINCVWNAVSAITQRPYGEIAVGVGINEVMHDTATECLAVAQAEGVSLPDDIRQAVVDIGRTMVAQKSSTAHDLTRSKRSEIDHLNGYVLRRGEALGIATPLNRALHALVRLLEERPAARDRRS